MSLGKWLKKVLPTVLAAAPDVIKAVKKAKKAAKKPKETSDA